MDVHLFRIETRRDAGPHLPMDAGHAQPAAPADILAVRGVWLGSP